MNEKQQAIQEVLRKKQEYFEKHAYKGEWDIDKEIDIENHIDKPYEIASQRNIIAPDQKLREVVRDILFLLFNKENIKLDFVNPLHEGGIGIEYSAGEDRFLIELYNDGGAVFLRKRKDQSKEMEGEALDLKVNNIVDFIKTKL